MTAPTATPRARYAGLDGLRAIAVGLVIAYHLFPGWVFAGGFVGVDVFFVISGFLITTLLLGEHAATGTVSLLGFWRRRARRLVPALVLLVTVCASAAWIVGGDVLARIGWQILGTATFSYNWVSIAAGGDYFSAGTPELFRNLWSLAVEEQFYVVWPLLLPLVLLIRARWARVAVALVAALASAAWMATVVLTGGGLTRAYFGTDSHSFGILLGIALAFGLERMLRQPSPVLERPAIRATAGVVGVLALAGVIVIATLADTGTVATFPGALLGACVLTVVAITAGVWPGSWFGRALDIAPLRWAGDRSYGLYLWHWPLLVLLSAGLPGVGPASGVPVWLGLVALVLTILLAELSYRVVETPVRRLGFRGALRRVGVALGGRPSRRFGALAGIAAGALVLGGTAAAVSAAPATTSAEAAVQAGIDALQDQPETPALPTPEPTTSGSPDPLAPDATASPEPTLPPVSGDEITAVGDSVMLASAPALVERFPGIQVDAEVSRQMYAGPDILERLAASGQLRAYVIVALGTNGSIDRASLDRLAEIVGPERDLILVTAYAPRDWIPGVNGELTSFADERRGVELADWSTAIAGRVDLLAGDQVHPGSEGGRIFADAVARAVDLAEIERADAQHRLRQAAEALVA